jgi:capsular polysaccharide biosynthesis protein
MSNQPSSDPTIYKPGWLEDDDGLFADEPSASFPPDALITFRFLRDAVRRHLRIWLVLAMVGLAGGIVSNFVLPSASVSSAKLLLTHRDGDDPQRAMATDVSMATTRSVAERVIDTLKLPETPDDLLKQYTATNLTDRILEIKATAKTPDESTTLARVIAQTYLIFRTEQIELQGLPVQRDAVAAQDELTLAKQAFRAAGGDPEAENLGQTPAAVKLIAAREKAQYMRQQLDDQTLETSKMKNSRMLDAAAPVLVSAKRSFAIKAASGLIVGLFLGIGFVIVRALISDRLWKRQDIARALGARVRLSTGRPPRWRLWPFRKRLHKSERKHSEIRLMVRHLDQRITWAERPVPSLAVVSVDDVRACSLAVASLAVSVAEEGKHVLVADLTGTGALAARLGVKKAGIHESRFSEPGRRIDVYRPDRDAGPAEGCYRQLGDNNRPGGSGDLQLDAAWDVADLVLTLATLTPALGADHLSTWASRAAVVVTAGRSTITKIRATGEMLRLAGLEIASGVVLHADGTDEGVGVAEAETSTRTLDMEMFGR